MFRTQIFLSEKKREELALLSQITGKSQSELIREAVDCFLKRSRTMRRDAVLERAAGLWKDRSDLPDFRALRGQWDR